MYSQDKFGICLKNHRVHRICVIHVVTFNINKFNINQSTKSRWTAAVQSLELAKTWAAL